MKKERKTKEKSKKVPKRCAFFLFLCFFSLLLALPVCGAEEATTLPGEAEISDAWQQFLDSIPGEVADLLPPGFFEENMATVGDAVGEGVRLSAILGRIADLLRLSLPQNLRLLAAICGLLILSAILQCLTESYGKQASTAFSFCSVTVLAGLVMGEGGANFPAVATYFDTVKGLFSAILPLMGTLYAMGGNMATALANHGVMSVFLAVLELLCSGSVVPVGGLCIAMALSDAVSGRSTLRPLATLIKRAYTWGLSLFMLLLSGVLGMQSVLAKGADTLALRTVRFAAGSFLPVVGGSLSEALRTVAGSVTYLRTAVGMGGVLVLFLAFLPMFLSVLTTRIVFLLSGAVAGMLSCPREEKLLGECAAVWGYFLAVISCLFVMAVFSLSLFAKCATAI